MKECEAYGCASVEVSAPDYEKHQEESAPDYESMTHQEESDPTYESITHQEYV